MARQPGMPKNAEEAGTITIDLSGMDAVSFKTKFGGDFPMGDESHAAKPWLCAAPAPKRAFFLSLSRMKHNQ